jgi:hypothetical protein
VGLEVWGSKGVVAWVGGRQPLQGYIARRVRGHVRRVLNLILLSMGRGNTSCNKTREVTCGRVKFVSVS